MENGTLLSEILSTVVEKCEGFRTEFYLNDVEEPIFRIYQDNPAGDNVIELTVREIRILRNTIEDVLKHEFITNGENAS
jgi:hypothetical protein